MQIDKQENRFKAMAEHLTRIKNWDVFSAIPEEWHIVLGATTIPNGYQLISNGQSLFSGKRETALIEYER